MCFLPCSPLPFPLQYIAILSEMTHLVSEMRTKLCTSA